MGVRDFLVEIGTEELPPQSLARLSAAFAEEITSGLARRQLPHGVIQVFATPRRLAVMVPSLATQQPDQEQLLLGPPVAAAFDKAGNPTPAAQGFSRKCNVALDQLEQLDTGKGVKLAYRKIAQGATTSSLLPEITRQALEKLPISKRMRWGDKRVEFVRPTHWLLMLFGNEVIDAKILDQQAGRVTYGHRFQYNQAITIEQPSSYAQALEKPGKVVADFRLRRERIRHQVAQLAEQLNGHAVIDPELLDEVTALVEWPVALAGRFDEAFLRLPAAALISSMKEHQKYFHVEDAQGSLLPVFITVSNIESDNPDAVVSGNERVIRPRLADAAFFYDTDRKTPLATRAQELANIVFQTKLGSLADKAQRVAALAEHLATATGGDSGLAKRAALLCKADLVTLMVGEFPSLQGLMGRDYAAQDGEPEEVAQAIYEHYLPRYAGDEIPQTGTGCAVAIADKLDTLTGLFVIGQPPTGDKDPFALRRAALGILRIMVVKKIKVDLTDIIGVALAQYQQLNAAPELRESIFEFFLERFRAWYQEEGISPQVFQAVYARRPGQPYDFQQRLYAVNDFATMTDAQALSAANKRVGNILAKLNHEEVAEEVNEQLLIEPEERELATLVNQKQQQVAPLLSAQDYKAILGSLAELRPAVDRFFDRVMVMCEEDTLRQNRLALLKQLRELFLQVADISLLQAG